jgi:hypothetical protein
MNIKTNMIGQTINRITFLAYHGEGLYTYRCECGKEITTHVVKIPYECRSCAMKHNNKYIKHGANTTRLNSIWRQIRYRCSNPHSHQYQYYGGKGIKVCTEWQEFIPFQTWAMANGYQDNLTIERKDSNKDYCPENCTWIPQSEQQKTSSNSKGINIDGQTHNIADWCKILNIHRNSPKQATYRNWTVKEYLTWKYYNPNILWNKHFPKPIL